MAFQRTKLQKVNFEKKVLNIFLSLGVTIATEMRLSAQKQFFFFCFFFFLLGKIYCYTLWCWKKSPIEVSSLFDHLKMSENLEKAEIWQKVNITLPDTIGLRHCIFRVLPAIRFRIHQQKLVHLLLKPGMYERITIIQVTKWITDSPLLIPTTSSSIVVNFISV